MLEEAEYQEIGNIMETWSAAYVNYTDINKQLAEIDAHRAILVEKADIEEKQMRMAEQALNGMLQDVPDDDVKAVSRIRELAKDKMMDAYMAGVFG